MNIPVKNNHRMLVIPHCKKKFTMYMAIKQITFTTGKYLDGKLSKNWIELSVVPMKLPNPKRPSLSQHAYYPSYLPLGHFS